MRRLLDIPRRIASRCDNRRRRRLERDLPIRYAGAPRDNRRRAAVDGDCRNLAVIVGHPAHHHAAAFSLHGRDHCRRLKVINRVKHLRKWNRADFAHEGLVSRERRLLSPGRIVLRTLRCRCANDLCTPSRAEIVVNKNGDALFADRCGACAAATIDQRTALFVFTLENLHIAEVALGCAARVVVAHLDQRNTDSEGISKTSPSTASVPNCTLASSFHG